MSRGPGRWQRLILQALGQSKVVPISRMAVVETGGSLLPEEYRALNRAAHSLARKGVIGLVRSLGVDYRGQTNVQLLAVWFSDIDLLKSKGLSVVSVPDGTQSTHKRRLKGSIRNEAARWGVSKSEMHRWRKEDESNGDDDRG